MNSFLIKILKVILIFLLMINCDEKKEIKISSIANENIVNKNDTIIDSDYNFEQVFYGKDIPIQIINNQRLFDVYYYGYDGKIHKGQIVSHYSVVNDLKNVFDNLFNDKFPIYSVIPVNAFDWDDNKSMLANNTSCFNYRTTKSGKMSEHAKGLAIDINPLNNPYISRSKKIYPSGAIYDYDTKGTINPNSNIIKFFKEIGWKWGGDWIYSKDYQHFSLSGR